MPNAPRTALISAAHEASSDLVLGSLRAGAREFLRLPISADELKTVLDRVSEFCSVQVEAPKKKGRMIAVFSSKGGCGTSFIATNLAAADARTVLVDLNLQAGDLPLFSASIRNIPSPTWLRIARVWTSADQEFRHALLVAPFIAGGSKRSRFRRRDRTGARFRCAATAARVYDYVVLDPQHTFDSITLAALDQSDEIVLVLTLDIPAIRSTQRALEIFDRLGYPRKKIRIVVNRWSKQIDLDLRQVEKFLGEPVIGFIPSDYQTAVTSINLGTAVGEVRAKFQDFAGNSTHRAGRFPAGSRRRS